MNEKNAQVSEESGGQGVDEKHKVQYNYKELYTSTPEYAKEVAREDREDFNRWLANKTFGMVDGEKKTIAIYCGKNVYWFEADGYMHGEMLRSIDTNDIEKVRKARKDFENEVKSSGETFDSWSAALSVERAGEGSDFSFSAEQRGENGANDLYAGERERNSTRDQERGGRDYQIDLEEVNHIIRELREMLARLDAEPSSKVQKSRKQTGETVTISKGEMAKLHANYAGDKVLNPPTDGRPLGDLRVWRYLFYLMVISNRSPSKNVVSPSER